MEPSLKPATPKDSEFICRVKKAALREYVQRTWGWDDPFQRAFHAEHFNPAAIRIISWRNAAVGWVEVERDSDEMRVAGLYVLPQYQNCAVGTAVMKQVLAEASSLELPVTLQVLKVNPRAKALYESLGFATEGETDTHDLMRRWF